MIAAISFFWAGMIASISFIEAPLKFRAPGITQALGLGIGKKVFKALNRVELVLALIAVVYLILVGVVTAAMLILAAAIVILLFQTFWLLPTLARRADLVISGKFPPRGRVHILFILCEIAKLFLLIACGFLSILRMT